MSFSDLHAEWLSLIEISGPFLAVPILKEVFPQGLEQLDIDKRKHLRQAYEEWREALENDDPRFPELHQAWIAEVLGRGLELDEDGRGDVLKRGTSIPDKLIIDLPEHGVKLAPDAVVIDEQSGNALMLIQTFPVMTDLEANGKRDGWASSPAERIVQLCRQTGCRLGLLTNGERWMLVDAPVGAITTFASWYARLWGQEPITLQAFVHLLGIRRFFVDDSERLPALFDRSLKHQDEVTDALGEQVRRAVEVLIQALGKADLDRDHTLLANVSTSEIYEAALTVMMRLVFLLSAEERGLLLLGDERYEAHYALSTLRMQLRADSAEILECRWDAWSRLLALFRAVYGGIEHENLRMPALGGSLFDPDRFPFLEGRDKHSQWRTDPAKPLPIDNRTVLLLLDAIQQFQGRTLSYRALDVEQIGYVYEGLLERTVKRAKDVTLELDATKNAKSPWVTLTELETARKSGDERLAELLRERSGSSASRICNDLAKAVDDVLADKLLTACHADVALRDRVRPFANLLRVDPWGYPLVYPTGSFMVTTGSDRRETGTHYTPKSLTEAIVTETLTPVVYVGPAEGKPREEWQLKSVAELLDLKICDPAMGSGAFLVQVCRWLAERLVEAWIQSESADKYVTVEGEVRDTVTDEEPLPRNGEERIVIARRLIAERCLYGVDLNPLAVELAKLSIWLVTLAKGRPFGFLDHNLRCGDSLLGIHRLDQLTELSMTPGQKNTQMRIFGRNIEQAMAEAIELRKQLRKMPIRDIHDVEAMARLDANAKAKLEAPERIADTFIAEVFRTGGNGNSFDSSLIKLSVEAQQYLQGDIKVGEILRVQAIHGFSVDVSDGKERRIPFHWPLEFPEVFINENTGFDAIVGNPPFLGGQRITGVAGDSYRDWLVSNIAEGRRGSADLVAYFFLRAYSLLRQNGDFGLIAVNTIAEGDTRQVGLEAMIANRAVIYAAYPNEAWPGKASIVTSRVNIRKGEWLGLRKLQGRHVTCISPFLSDREEWSPKRLIVNAGISFQGCITRGLGFVLTADQARSMLEADSRNVEVIFPYLNGDDLNSDSEQRPTRWAINFWDWSEARAKTYYLPYRHVLEHVKPDRFRKRKDGNYVCAEPLRNEWWLYEGRRIGLHHAIGYGHYFERHPTGWTKNKHCLIPIVTARLSKFLTFSKLDGQFLSSDQIVVITAENLSWLAILDSAFHHTWAWQYRSTRGVGVVGLRYSPTDLLETFAFPILTDVDNEYLINLGEKLNSERKRLCKIISGGLTKLYNRYHSISDSDYFIEDLRKLHREIDHAVAKAYGWADIDFGHDFQEVSYLPENDRIRYTISESARIEVLQRLSHLNRQRYQEEVDARLHGKSTAKVKTARSVKNKAPAAQPSMQTSLFDLAVQASESSTSTPKFKTGNAWGSNASDQILAWLEAHKGWFTKSTILNGCSADPEAWIDAINELLNDDYIETRGNESNSTYRVKP
jgi:hypothetical protein